MTKIERYKAAYLAANGYEPTIIMPKRGITHAFGADTFYLRGRDGVTVACRFSNLDDMSARLEKRV